MKIIFSFLIFRDVPACSGMFRVRGFIIGPMRYGTWTLSESYSGYFEVILHQTDTYVQVTLVLRVDLGSLKERN